MIKRDKYILACILVVAAISLTYGWRLFWFLTDDAFISFRYISNSMLGHGYVWNPPPFRPVEGYTNFLWMILLESVWRIFNITPPNSSTYISLLFSYGTLLLTAAIILKMKLSKEIQPYRLVFLALVFLGILTNRTFLAWTSSGLETAMFNFFILLWVYLCFFTYKISLGRLLAISSVTLSIALSRPDGMLFGAALISIILLLWIWDREKVKIHCLIGLFPLVFIPVHLLWRKNLYGEWLPNTFYVKVTSVWPESGIKYLVSFVLEYALWFWGILFVAWVLAILNRRKTLQQESGSIEKVRSSEKVQCSFRLGAIGALLFHFIYYTFFVGGDYFEFRVYSYLVPIIFITFLMFASSLQLKVVPAAGLVMLFIFLSWPVQWLGWQATRQNTMTPIGSHLYVQISHKFPQWLRWYTSIYDKHQKWLNDHFVCLRHQEHKNFYQYLQRVSPTREEGMQLPPQNFPVLVVSAPGVFGWSMPRVNIIDKLGLNDYVVARNPVNNFKPRMMAHERSAPAGYLSCFSPNVEPHPQTKKPVVVPRRNKLTEQDIINCEKQWAEKVKNADRELL